MTVLLVAAASHVRDDLTIEQQAFIFLALVGLGVCCYYATVGVLRVLAVVAYLLWGCLILTARLLQVIEDAHYRGVARVRAYEARQRSTVDA